jgi:hypothetical protein
VQQPAEQQEQQGGEEAAGAEGNGTMAVAEANGNGAAAAEQQQVAAEPLDPSSCTTSVAVPLVILVHERYLPSMSAKLTDYLAGIPLKVATLERADASFSFEGVSVLAAPPRRLLRTLLLQRAKLAVKHLVLYTPYHGRNREAIKAQLLPFLASRNYQMVLVDEGLAQRGVPAGSEERAAQRMRKTKELAQHLWGDFPLPASMPLPYLGLASARPYGAPGGPGMGRRGGRGDGPPSRDRGGRGGYYDAPPRRDYWDEYREDYRGGAGRGRGRYEGAGGRGGYGGYGGGYAPEPRDYHDYAERDYRDPGGYGARGPPPARGGYYRGGYGERPPPEPRRYGRDAYGDRAAGPPGGPAGGGGGLAGAGPLPRSLQAYVARALGAAK